jgi:hypothetical protein
MTKTAAPKQHPIPTRKKLPPIAYILGGLLIMVKKIEPNRP